METIDTTPEITAMAEEFGEPVEDLRHMADRRGFMPMVATPVSLAAAFDYFTNASAGRHVPALVTAFYMLNNFHVLQTIRRNILLERAIRKSESNKPAE